jgi:hypothetical protein
MQPAFENVHVVEFCACKRCYRVPFGHFAELKVSKPSKNQVDPHRIQERRQCFNAINNNIAERFRPVLACEKGWAVRANENHLQPKTPGGSDVDKRNIGFELD